MSSNPTLAFDQKNTQHLHLWIVFDFSRRHYHKKSTMLTSINLTKKKNLHQRVHLMPLYTLVVSFRDDILKEFFLNVLFFTEKSTYIYI